MQFGFVQFYVVMLFMFQYGLIERVCVDCRCIVLLEGDDDCILCVVVILFVCDVVDLMILGDEMVICVCVVEFGVDFIVVQVFSLNDFEFVECFVVEYVWLCVYKGIIVVQVVDIVIDVLYFGMMMVYLGFVDGMVFGVVYIMVYIICFLFEIIKIKFGVNVVFSVFLMVFVDCVFVYGDCVVIFDLISEQFVDIVIFFVGIVCQFGIDLCVVMFLYLIGEFGFGVDVDKVCVVIVLVCECVLELLVEGLIQYDVVVDVVVVKVKFFDLIVVGCVMVFVFFDFNMGNNIYKVVQCFVGVVVIGFVLQGLNKFINDLFCGVLVDDIVNMVVIIVIQVQVDQR